MASDKRENPRHNKRLRLRYRVGDDKWRSAFTKDVSTKGLYIETTNIPTSRVIEIEVPDGSSTILMKGTIRRGKKVPVRMQRTMKGGFAVELQDVPDSWCRLCLDLEERARDRGQKQPTSARFVQVTTAVNDPNDR